ncbi:MAG: AMP-binding protein [Terrimicrobiaceae bacterium]|nr:AMP-binding protein [Terrimicrobiaceae bacterium]
MPDTRHLSSTIHEAFRACARQRPLAPALISQAGSMTYGELDAASDALASKLLSLGVQLGELVAVHPARSLGLAVGLLGILKAGAAYQTSSQ